MQGIEERLDDSYKMLLLYIRGAAVSQLHHVEIQLFVFLRIRWVLYVEGDRLRRNTPRVSKVFKDLKVLVDLLDIIRVGFLNILRSVREEIWMHMLHQFF